MAPPETNHNENQGQLKKIKPIEEDTRTKVEIENFQVVKLKGVQSVEKVSGECRARIGIYFKCGKKGHFAQECHSGFASVRDHRKTTPKYEYTQLMHKTNGG